LLKEMGWLLLGKKPNLHYNNIIEGTKAFSMDPGRIYINRADRYPRGSVTEDEQENIINDIVEYFSKLEINGKKVIKAVFRKEDIYKGPFLENAPDIVLLANKGFNLSSSLANLFDEPSIKPGILTGKHSQDDAFLYVKGKKNEKSIPNNPTVEDITKILDQIK
jgi:predicted AlkP superfamily phosphohydrolase/phosphomutase